MMSRLWPSGLLFSASALALALAPGCRHQAEEPALVVMAASSLTDVLPEVGRAWSEEADTKVVFSFDSTSRLATQVKAGAPGDVFIAANPIWMEDLASAGALKPESQRALLSNSLVFIVPEDASSSVGNFDGLGQGSTSLALAGEAVPAGAYARQSLKSLGVWKELEPRVVAGDNVRTVLHWIAQGEVDGGIVYGTDAAVEPRVRVAFALPKDTHDAILYPGAVLQGAAHPEAAASFLRFCHCEGQAIFERRGFVPLPGNCDVPR